MNFKQLDKKSKFKLVGLIVLLIAITFFGITFIPWILEKVKQPEALRDYLRSFGSFGFLMYILLQAVHVLLVVIPGDLFNICGGFIYDIPLGFVLSMIGIMLGTVCAFYISRLLGYEIISKIIPKEKIEKISTILDSSKGTIGMLIICLIPGIPKDLMMYIAGLTPIKASKLFTIYALSRIPGTLIWVSVGAQVYNQNQKGIVITLVGLAILIVSGFILQRMYKGPQSEQ
jgi:uncharacterized membrane protein YdjX (TVP38/TMEM64 family)